METNRLHFVIRQLSDFVLLNAYAYETSGFYHGKAGAALTLFETSRILEDPYIEEEAFGLLQEALLSKTNDISFRNGLSGIGFVLIYLSSFNFINVDINELFKEKIIFIEEKIKEKSSTSSQLFENIEICYFLNMMIDILQKKELIPIRKKIINEADAYIEGIFNKYILMPTSEYRSIFLNSFTIYLAARPCDIKNKKFAQILNRYIDLYKRNLLSGNYFISNYLNNIMDIEIYSIDLIEKNFKMLTLDKLSNMLYLKLSNYTQKDSATRWIEHEFINLSLESIEIKLISYLHPQMMIPGYGQGISRFLLMLCKLAYLKKNINTDRMDYLFKP